MTKNTRRMNLKNITALAATACAIWSLSSPIVSYASSFTMQKSSVVLNGHTFSKPYKFVYQGTTYMPIWYVMQVLKQINGYSVDWNGVTHEWVINGPFGVPKMSASGTGKTSIILNGKTVESNILTLVATDPSSGQATTFMPIWYIMQALNAIGFDKSTDSWNGSVWSLSFTQSSFSGSSSSNSTSPSNADITSATQEYLKLSEYGQKAVSGYSPLATATQWYPNSSDVFYDKQIPTSDFVNNKVIQKSPYVIMNEQAGPSGNLWFELEYVGKGSTTSYWKAEQVDPKTGLVTDILQDLMPFNHSTFPDLAVPSSGGYSFTAPPVNPTWGIGGQTFFVPNSGWNPNKN